MLPLLLAAGAAPAAPRPSQVVVAIRYLQPGGTSHARLYLFRQDGRLLRQLTTGRSGQDRDPIFAPDGETVVFRRTVPRGPDQFWSVQEQGGGLRRLASAPAWYLAAKATPCFTNVDSEYRAVAALPLQAPGDQAPAVRAPDGSVELVLKLDPASDDDRYDLEGHGKHYTLRYLKTGRTVELGTLPGFIGLYDLLHRDDDPRVRFELQGALRVAFFGLHLNSTDGSTVFALDLRGPRLVRLSPNWAVPFPLPGEPAFLTLAENRYVPIAGSKMTANCSYLERWDAALHRVRYSRPGAALCYGASVHRPGRTPPVLAIRVGDR